MDILSDRRKKKKWPIKCYYVSSRHGNLKCERDLKWPIKWKRDRKDCTTILNKSFWCLDSSPAHKIQ
jgi:hypothetical protein